MEKASIVFDEGRVVVVDKPCGPTSEDVARELGRRLVHRIDRLTSGLLLLADDARTATRLQRALRDGRVAREYRVVVHGALTPRRMTSFLVRDRGDGLRGSGEHGKESVADVVTCVPCGACTLAVARLVSGRTHQLRIQLAEAGHPIVGEPVYIRDAKRAGMQLLSSSRLLLHAERLAFEHPTTHREVDLRSAAPVQFSTQHLAELLRTS